MVMNRKQLKTPPKVIGYQVVDNKGIYFPGYFGSTVLSLDLALESQGKDTKRWRLWPIREGEIKSPTFVGERSKGRR